MAVAVADFETVARSLHELTTSGPVALRILRPFTPFAISFDINFRDAEVAAGVEKSGFARPAYRQAIEDVEQVLASVVQGSTLDREGEDGEPSDVTASKVAFVKQVFDIDDLKRRAWVKETGKDQVLFDSTWEVSLKTADETKAPPGDVPVPVGILTLRGAGLRNPFSILTGADGEELQLLTDRSDLKAMQETLRRLDDALSEVEAGRSNEGSDQKDG